MTPRSVTLTSLADTQTENIGTPCFISTVTTQQRDIRSRLPPYHRQLLDIRRQDIRRPFKIGVLNAQSLNNKAAAINDCITSNHLQVMAVVETWHESMESPSMIAVTYNRIMVVSVFLPPPTS